MPIQIAEVVDSLQGRTCVILLGPGFAKNKAGEHLHAGLIQYLKEKQLAIEEDIDNLLTCDPKTKTRVYGYLKQYYRDNGTPSNLHKQLSLVPCHLYLSVVPDLLLNQTFDDNPSTTNSSTTSKTSRRTRS